MWSWNPNSPLFSKRHCWWMCLQICHHRNQETGNRIPILSNTLHIYEKWACVWYLLEVAPKGALMPNWTVCSCVRACVTLENLFTPHLVVRLSPRAEIWYVCVPSINDDVQILTFPWFNNNRNFQNSRFLYGDYFKFWKRLLLFPNRLHIDYQAGL